MTTKEAAFNSSVVSALERGEIKQAQEATTSYTRTGIFEASFISNILPKETVTDDQLMDTTDESVAMLYEKQPQSGPAKWVPFGTMPNGKYITSSKYVIPAAELQTEEYKKNINELRTTKMPIQSFLSDDMIRRGVEMTDHKWVGTCNQILDDSDANGIQRETGKRQIISFADSINRTTWADAKKLMLQGSTYKGMEHMYRMRTSCALMNEATAQEFTKLDRNQYGGDGAQKNFEEGLTQDSFGGVKLVYTIKDNIVPDNWVYFFTAPQFLGHYYEVKGWTTFMELRGTALSFFSYWIGGCGIGNIAGVQLAKFNQ